MPKPLDGVTVLDLTRVLAGPSCTMMLGDFGADVIKIEQPGRGDDTREWKPPEVGGESAYYLAINRNKRSVSLNLQHPAGKDILLRLAQQSHQAAFIEQARHFAFDPRPVDFEDQRHRILDCQQAEQAAQRPGGIEIDLRNFDQWRDETADDHNAQVGGEQ